MTNHFPNEKPKYRAARKKLLKAELALRKQVEQVASLRRKLPPGGEVPEDYVFESEQGKVRLSELFVNGNTLVAYSFMSCGTSTPPRCCSRRMKKARTRGISISCGRSGTYSTSRPKGAPRTGTRSCSTDQ